MEKKFFSFLFNTVFYSGIPKETIRMPFRGLTMLKSCKLVIKGGLCYRFAMVVKNKVDALLPLKCKHCKIVSKEVLCLLHVTFLFVLGMQPSE